MSRLAWLSCGLLLEGVSGGVAGAVLPDGSEIAFSRIVHGWTNYSTAFNATEDTGTRGDYASVASLYTPQADAALREYGVIVIGDSLRAPDFGPFEFRVLVWSSLDALVREPRAGDVSTWTFAVPTGGSTTVADAITRGGRPAYELRFCLTNNPCVLRQGQDYWVGFVARTDTQSQGELYVPTSNHEGASDVQAGDLVAGGWRELVNAGGSTVYSGQLATELFVRSRPSSPPLALQRLGGYVRICWPASAADFVLESTFHLSSAPDWFPVDAEPFAEEEMLCVDLPAGFTQQWFRLSTRVWDESSRQESRSSPTR